MFSHVHEPTQTANSHHDKVADASPVASGKYSVVNHLRSWRSIPSLRVCYRKTYPLRDYGIKEPISICKLPDGRTMLFTTSGDCFVFNGVDWEKTETKLPAGCSYMWTDSTSTMWIGGNGFFGSLAPDFSFHDLSAQYFAAELDSALLIRWIYETGDWIHFANHATLYQYNRVTKECKTIHFDGMFNAYHWMWEGKLYLGTATEVQVWKDDHFEKLLDWNHKYRAYVGWIDQDQYYFLNATHIHVYDRNGKLPQDDQR